MLNNPNICIVAFDESSETWLRVKAKVIDDSENLEAKKVAIAEFDWMEEAGYTLDNPNFAVLYLSDATAEICDENGEIKWSAEF